MHACGVLLIDLENFYLSREQHRGPSGYDKTQFTTDLQELLGFAQEAAEDRRLIVRRAYANFNAVRYRKTAPADYFLQRLPEILMRHGVEPVQVFSLSGGGKNAADMRIAMDATALLGDHVPIEQYLFVTGDADFIPVILELKRHGQRVSVIGVRGATNQLLQRYVDDFDFFEDLVAAREVTTRTGEVPVVAPREGASGPEDVADLETVGATLRRVLEQTGPTVFAAVKPLLSRALGRQFDPLQYNTESVGDFLRTYATQLGVAVRRAMYDWEVSLPGPEGIGPNTGRDILNPHTPAEYLRLMKTGGDRNSPVGETKIHPLPWPALVAVCDTAAAALLPATPEAPTPRLRQEQLYGIMVRGCEAVGIPTPDRFVRSALFHLQRSEAVRLQDDTTLELAADITDAAALRRWLVMFELFVLRYRLTESGVDERIKPEVFAQAVYGADHDPEQLALVTEMTDYIYQQVG